MNYNEAVRRLLSLGKELASPQQSKVQKFDLENIRVLSDALGQPHRARPCAHIAGTNGKGSTAAMLESIVRAAGLRTGLYTSPHLERINERIRINGRPIEDDAFAESFTRVHRVIESCLASGQLRAHPTYFECMTAMAFDTFAQERIDFAVYEVGMGGRLDSTNLVQPELAIITQVDFDHENFLGHAIEQIAAEKAGIIKPGIPVLTSAERPEAREVIAARCAEVGARFFEMDSMWQIHELQSVAGRYRVVVSAADGTQLLTLDVPLRGRFQVRNALTAASAALLLAARGCRITAQAIQEGIATVEWPGRLERIAEAPDVFLDGTHNPAGARELLKFWDENLRGTHIFLVYGSVRDKAVDEIAGLLFPRADEVIITEPRQSRAVSATLLAEMTAHLARRYHVIRNPLEALDYAVQLAQPEDAIFATGSLFLVGDLRGQRDRWSHVMAGSAGKSPSGPHAK